MNPAADVWAKVISLMQPDMTATTINTWFDDATAVALEDDRFVLYSPTRFKRDIIATRYVSKIQTALRDLFSCDMEVTVLTEGELDQYQQEPEKNDFFPGTAAQQLADYLFAAHLGGRSVSDVFRWCSNERDTSPADILSEYPRYAGIASRVSSVIALTPETRSGVFGSLQTMVAFLADPEIIDWIDPHRDTNGNIDERRGLFDPYEFATSEDTLYLLSAQGRPSTALTASLTAVVAFTAFQRAQSEFTGNNRRLPVPLCCVLDEAANICRWPELADVYSYFGSAGIPIMTIWQNPDQGRAAFGETNFGSLFNNANITVYLGGIKDAKFLGEISQLVGQREIVRGSVNIDGNGRRSVNNSIQKENILDVSDLTEWPVGRALLLASQSRAQIVKTLPWTGNRQWADALTQAKAKAREEQRKAA